jgi:hypothetical protein
MKRVKALEHTGFERTASVLPRDPPKTDYKEGILRRGSFRKQLTSGITSEVGGCYQVR